MRKAASLDPAGQAIQENSFRLKYTREAVKRLGARTFRELTHVRRRDFLALPFTGRRSLRDLEETLSGMGLALAEEPVPLQPAEPTEAERIEQRIAYHQNQIEILRAKLAGRDPVTPAPGQTWFDPDYGGSNVEVLAVTEDTVKILRRRTGKTTEVARQRFVKVFAPPPAKAKKKRSGA